MKKLFVTVLVGICGVRVGRGEAIVSKGSDTLGGKLVPQLAEQFKAQYPGTTFDIAAEGSATGFAALIDKTAAIGMASRPAKPEEIANGKAKGVQMKETIVAYNGITLIFNPPHSIKSLTKNQQEHTSTVHITAST